MFTATANTDDELVTLDFIEDVRDGVYAPICAECLEQDRMDLSEESSADCVFYYSFA
jgi:hypothetical protein